MRWLAVILALLLLAAPAAAQDSAETNQKYIEYLGEFTASPDVYIPVEVPSWAEGMLIFINVTTCTACAGDIHYRLIEPDATSLIVTTTVNYVANMMGFNSTGWDKVLVHPRKGAGSGERHGVPLTPGSIALLIDETAGGASSIVLDMWVRWIPKRPL